jgi:hypothetical protein
MPPVGIFKCNPEDHEIRSLTPDREPPKQHEWDTPTRVSVKVLTELGHTHATPSRSKQACQSAPNEQSSRDPTEGPGENASAHLTNSAKETSV